MVGGGDRNMNESPHQLTAASHESQNMFREKERHALINMAQDASASPGKPLSTEMMQNTNLYAVRTRVIELQGTIERLKMAYQTHHDLTWPDVLSQFAVANAQIFTLLEDVKPILRNLSVFPSLVSAENATTLPILLSSKLLPQMEVEETSRKEQQLAPLRSLPAEEQANHLKAQMEAMKQVSDVAHKMLIDGKKALGLGTRSGPGAMGPQRDAKEVELLKKQEAILRTAVLSGEGLRVTPSPHDRPRKLPLHLAPPGPEPATPDEVAPPLEDAGTKKVSPLVRTPPVSAPSPTLPAVSTPLPPSPLVPSSALMPTPIPMPPPLSPALTNPPPSTLGGAFFSGIPPPIHPASPLLLPQVGAEDSLLGAPAGMGVGEVPLSLLQIQVQQRQQRQKVAGQQQRRL